MLQRNLHGLIFNLFSDFDFQFFVKKSMILA